ncbi:MAG: hypothetical protein GY866_37245 [Proteobacteria bacterium]|nr:hypothetical protein [Pseudomonadota bacterium]
MRAIVLTGEGRAFCAGADLETRAISATGESADAEEGIESFLEKREPDFKDKVSQDMPDFFPWWKERRFE